MNESDFQGILAEICAEEIAELNKFPPFKPSLRHRRAMKRIFALYKEKTHITVSNPPIDAAPKRKRLRFSKILIILFAAIICAALLTGFSLVYFSKNFHGRVYKDNTQLFAVNTENCPTTIEYEYYLPDLPDGFEMVQHDSSPSSVYIKYKNSSGQVIVLSQYAKMKFTTHYNTEHHDFEEIEVNGHSGLCIDFSDDEGDSSIMIWDNDDYLLELSGDLDKENLLVLAKSAKILEN